MKPILTLLALLITNMLSAQIYGAVSAISCESKTEINLRTLMDTHVEAEYCGEITHMSKEFDPSFFNHKSKKTNKILLTIHHATRGELLLKANKEYIPKENEILFLFEIEEKKESSSQKIFFKMGQAIKGSIGEKPFDFKKLMHFLKCSVFRNEIFPEDLVRNAYNNEISN